MNALGLPFDRIVVDLSFNMSLSLLQGEKPVAIIPLQSGASMEVPVRGTFPCNAVWIGEEIHGKPN